MDERQKRIIEAGGEKNLLDASLRMTEASRRITYIVPKLPMVDSLLKVSEKWRRISEMVRPPLLAQQHNTFKSIAEVVKPFAVLHNNTFESTLGSNKLFSDYQWVNDMFKPYDEISRNISEPMRRLQESLASITSPFARLTELAEQSRKYFEIVGPIIDENDRRLEMAKQELEKIPAKFDTVSDKVRTVMDAERDIRFLGRIEADCVFLVDEFEKCKGGYIQLDADGFDEELTQIESNLQIVYNHLSRCRKQLNDRQVQLVFLAKDDAEQQARPKPKSPKEECHVFFPDYVSEFLEMERDLIQYKHLSSDLHWIKDKQLLASFVQKLLEFKYIRQQNRKSIKEQRKIVREFFELRYSVKITEQFKPSKVEQHPLPASFPVVLIKKG